MTQRHHLAVFAFASTLAFAIDSAGETPAAIHKQDGPVQGYQGGYDNTDKSKAPAASGSRRTDAANADEGRHGNQAVGTVARIEGRQLTLDSGLVLVVPPTLEFGVLTAGTRIRALYERQEGTNVVTGIVRE